MYKGRQKTDRQTQRCRELKEKGIKTRRKRQKEIEIESKQK